MGSGRIVIARPMGVPVEIAPSWFLIAAYITFLFAPSVESAVPELGSWKYAISFGVAVLFYASVLLHELGHAVVALRAGLPVKRISLHLLGGATEFQRPDSPGREARIAAAGPAVSLVVSLVAFLVAEMLEPGTLGELVARALAVINLLVGILNLLPGLPLDGGQVMSAAIWRLTGRRHTGTQWAGWIGRGLAVAVLVVAVALASTLPERFDTVDVLWAGLIAAFLWVGATTAIQQAGLQQRLPALHAGALTRRAIPVPADLPLAEALRQAHEAGAGALVVTATGGEPVGLVIESAVLAVPDSRRPWIPVGDLSRRLESGHVLTTELTGEDLLTGIRQHPASEYLVLDGNGDIYGVLATADVERALTRS